MLVLSTGSYVVVSGKDKVTDTELIKPKSIVFQNKSMKCRLHLRVVNADKSLMIRQSKAHRVLSESLLNTTRDAPTEAVMIPPPRDLIPDDDWVTITSGETKPMKPQDLEKANWKQGDGIWYI